MRYFDRERLLEITGEESAENDRWIVRPTKSVVMTTNDPLDERIETLVPGKVYGLRKRWMKTATFAILKENLA